ncbi:hypothetical protein F5Y09DRAFT_296896 [Xylaria sp. FL1042]|nr:hypothetical protein F5Y09DRAFT_296896 [Xylaria sp. FL1042]
MVMAFASISHLQGLRLEPLRSGFVVVRVLSLSGCIAGVVAIEKWLVVGFGRGTIFISGFGSKLPPINLANALATLTGFEEGLRNAQLASLQSIPRLWRQLSCRLP